MAKHSLSTNSTFIEFDSEFDNYFTLADSVYIHLRDDIEDLDDLDIKININTIVKDKEVEDLRNNEYIQEFTIYNREEDTEVILRDKKLTAIYPDNALFKEIIKAKKKNKYDEEGWITIPLNKLVKCEEHVMFLRIENSELTKPLSDLTDLIAKKKRVEVDTVSELIDKLKYLFKRGNIHEESIHVETLARNLVRQKDNVIALPDWDEEDPEYVITSVHNALLSDPSILNSLSFERIGEQLSNPLSYKKRDTNIWDRFYIL